MIHAGLTTGRRLGVVIAGVVAFGVAVWFLVTVIEPGALVATGRAAVGAPATVALAVSCYAAAFGLRAMIWRRLLPGLAFGQALAALHVALAGNHLLPLRLGEPLRVYSVVRRADVPVAAATASTLLLRAADVLAVLLLGALLAPVMARRLLGGWAWLTALAAAAAVVGAAWWLRRIRHRSVTTAQVRLPGVVDGAGVVAAWVLESVVLWQAAGWAGLDVGLLGAVAVTAVTIVAQVLAVTPGGFGTYEAAATAAFVALGAAPGPALAAAVAAHVLKTGYALGTGAIAAFAPSPGLLGPLRLPASRIGADRVRAVAGGAGSSDQADAAPIVLLLPARNEAASVGEVVRRAPAVIRGHPVACVVVDDGSDDRTAAVAEEAGARVVATTRRGLGAAVRRGLAEGVALGAVAVAFCDADGEYDPAELERLVAPILDGAADYVVGSRFTGTIRRMHPHRRLGNRLLTAWLSWVARTPISDGQSGFRALSAGAAATAEITHDYNYAQVLTLDLLAKGYRYAEVPIGYAFRDQGRSFVHPGAYLRQVVPAVLRVVAAHSARR